MEIKVLMHFCICSQYKRKHSNKYCKHPRSLYSYCHKNSIEIQWLITFICQLCLIMDQLSLFSSLNFTQFLVRKFQRLYRIYRNIILLLPQNSNIFVNIYRIFCAENQRSVYILFLPQTTELYRFQFCRLWSYTLKPFLIHSVLVYQRRSIQSLLEHILFWTHPLIVFTCRQNRLKRIYQNENIGKNCMKIINNLCERNRFKRFLQFCEIFFD